MREKPQGCGLEGVEHVPQRAPQSTPAYGGSALLQREAIPPVPTQTAPHKSHLQAGGTLQPPHFLSHLSQACQGRKFRGLQLQRLLATLVPRAPCKPQKRKSELRPDLPMLTNSNYHGLWCKGGWGNFVRECIGSSQGWKV